ncbi:MAG TPA: serine/threonine-protein kinase [Myxococcaceae bacterium]|jgi:hypothetical protein
MALIYPAEWKFAMGDEVLAVPSQLVSEFHDLVAKIAAGAPDEQDVVEGFKSRFGFHGRSTSLSWAMSDLLSAMDAEKRNAPNFIDCFWSELESLKKANVATPTLAQFNAILSKHGVPFEVKPPNLVRHSVDTVLVDGNKNKELDGDGGAMSKLMQYSLGELLGVGGFGQVFVAKRETSAGTFEFALKLLDPSPFISDPEKAKARFRREIRAIQGLQHRGIVYYLDAGLDGRGRPYLVMPLIRGLDIRAATEAVDFRQRIVLMTEVLDALAHAHEHDVLHRDLKPSNILVRNTDMQPVIVDFGNAYIIDELDRQSLTTTLVGSLGYIPSEVLANPKARSPLHDIYSIAVITYEIIARKRPDPAEYEPLASVYPELAKLDVVLQRALGPISKRHPTAHALRLELLGVTQAL